MSNEKNLEEGSYVDAKGRTRWHQNDEIALRLLELHTFLIIADYPEKHASRYPWIANYVSRFPEPVSDLIAQGRLIEEIGGVGEIIAEIIKEFVETGTSTKLEEFAGDTPRTIVEFVPIPGLGAKTIKRLYEEVSVDSLASLRTAINEGRLKGFSGIGKKTLEKFEAYLNTAL
jgi:DNA polymerase (family 10)